jgi:hypothetical protein
LKIKNIPGYRIQRWAGKETRTRMDLGGKGGDKKGEG